MRNELAKIPNVRGANAETGPQSPLCVASHEAKTKVNIVVAHIVTQHVLGGSR